MRSLQRFVRQSIPDKCRLTTLEEPLAYTGGSSLEERSPAAPPALTIPVSDSVVVSAHHASVPDQRALLQRFQAAHVALELCRRKIAGVPPEQQQCTPRLMLHRKPPFIHETHAAK